MGQTISTAFAHEVGHALTALFKQQAEAINEAAFGRTQVLMHFNEGYPVTFENRYRQETGSPQRRYYATEGDYADPGNLPLFPENQ